MIKILNLKLLKVLMFLTLINLTVFSETKLYFEYTDVLQCKIDGKLKIIKVGEFTDKDLIKYKGFEIIRENEGLIISREYWLIESNEWDLLLINYNFSCSARLFVLSEESYINDCRVSNLLNIFYDFHIIKRDGKIFIFEPKKIIGSCFLFTIEF